MRKTLLLTFCLFTVFPPPAKAVWLRRFCAWVIRENPVYLKAPLHKDVTGYTYGWVISNDPTRLRALVPELGKAVGQASYLKRKQAREQSPDSVRLTENHFVSHTTAVVSQHLEKILSPIPKVGVGQPTPLFEADGLRVTIENGPDGYSYILRARADYNARGFVEALRVMFSANIPLEPRAPR